MDYTTGLILVTNIVVFSLIIYLITNWVKNKLLKKKIINYGLVEPTQKCNNCNRPNHKDNTHCWYCKEKL